ncbi:hypothetical protein [Clostridium sp. DL1XJH146]
MEKNKIKWQVKLVIGLILLSVVLYFATYVVFHDTHHMFEFLMEDLAFIPVEVLVVSLIIDRVIEKREKQNLMEKLNMIIGVFFIEVGGEILKNSPRLDSNLVSIKDALEIKNEWNDADFNKAIKKVKNYEAKVKVKDLNLIAIKEFLIGKRDFLLRLLENPNLLDHETFTYLLNSVFHLEEELSCRNLNELAKDDEEHLYNDMLRVNNYIIVEWLQYMKHIKNNYPYLYSTAVKDNPFKF